MKLGYKHASCGWELRGAKETVSRAASINCDYMHIDTAAVVRFKGGSIHEGQEFAPITLGVCTTEQALLGPTRVGSRCRVDSSKNVTGLRGKEYNKNQKLPSG